MTQSQTSCVDNKNHSHTKKNKDKSTKIPTTTLQQPSKLASKITSLSKNNKLNIPDIVHDPTRYMFKTILDTKGNSAALCYLPTRYKNIIEFYHIEIPSAYRNQGLGDLLLAKAFQWVQEKHIMVIPTCPFVLKYLEARFPDQKNGHWSNIMASE